jgi:multidrug efflux pump subunit AcrB
MGSLYINDFTTYNRTFHVVVQADTAFRTMISDMDKYYVRNQAANGAAGHADQFTTNRSRAADLAL